MRRNKPANKGFKALVASFQEYHSPDLVREFTEVHLGKPWGLGTVTGRASSSNPNMKELGRP